MDNTLSQQNSREAVEHKPRLFSCIDIGTNSVKLLTADLSKSYPSRIYEHSIISRLGEGMDEKLPMLQPQPIERTLDAVNSFYETARSQNVQTIAAVGTAALREAKNREALLKPLQDKWGLDVEILSGEEEARYSYLAVSKDPLWSDKPGLLVVDIGGGSTEIVTGKGSAILSRASTSTGAVRITENFLHADPPAANEIQNANFNIAKSFSSIKDAETLETYSVVGVGGTISNLCSMQQGRFVEADELHGMEFTLENLERQIELLQKTPLAARKDIPGLDPRRADILLGGALILHRILLLLKCDSMTVSTRGLRWGVLYDKFLNR